MRSVLFWVASLILSLLLLASCESNGSTGTGGALSGLAGERMGEDVIEVELAESSEPSPEYGSPPELVVEAGSRSGEFVLFASGPDTRISFTSILYDPEKVHFVGAFGGEIEQVIFLAMDNGVGKVDVGWSIPHPESSPGPSGTVSLLTLKFAPGSSVSERMLSAVPRNVLHKVDDLSVEWNEEALVLTFTERNPGDYDRSGDVTIADVAQIARHYLEDVVNYETDPVALIDGSGDGQINIADVAIIAQQYLVSINGYAIQYSFDTGLSFLPPSAPFVPGSLPYFTRGHVQVTVDQSKAYPIWTIEVPNENLPPVPGMNPGNADLRVRVYPSDGEAPGSFSDGAEIIVTGGMDITPPEWDETVGVTGLDPEIDSNTLIVSFGGSTDDSGEPTVFKIYYAKTLDFTIDAVNAETIAFWEYAPAPEVVPPYAFELVGLEPGVEYTALIRTTDRAFPEPNLDDNIVSMAAAVDAGGLLLGDISVEDFEPSAAQPVLASVEVSGGDGVYSAAWEDGDEASGHFYFPNVDGNLASVTWASSSGDEIYNLKVEVTDASGHRGVQQSGGIIVQTAAAPLFEDVVYPIIETSCAPCHVGQTLGGLDLDGVAKAYESLVGVSSAQSSLNLVEEFEPERSYFVLKLDGRFIEAGGSGGLMPSPESPLNAGDIRTIIGWIFGGAKGEGAVPDTSPPAWNDQIGVISVAQVVDTQALDVTFGSATDAESPPVEYRLWYAPSTTFDIGDLAGTAMLEVFTSAGTKQVSGLEWSTEYSFLARARDSAEIPNETDNTNIVIGTVVDEAAPGLVISDISADISNPLTAEPVTFSITITGGDGDYTVTWSDDSVDAGYFYRPSVVGGSASVIWAAHITLSDYLLTVFVEDGSGLNGEKSMVISVSPGAILTFDNDIYPIITNRCATCHVGGTSGGLDMGNAVKAYDNIVGVNSNQVSLKRIQPLDPENSYLILKLEGRNIILSRMPKGRPALPDAEIDQFVRWVFAGAER